MQIDECMNILLGIPSIRVSLSNFTDDELFNKLHAWDQAGCMMGLCSLSTIDRETGGVGCHAYTLISAYKIPGFDPILKIRNPWGMFEFKEGKYSDNSKV